MNRRPGPKWSLGMLIEALIGIVCTLWAGSVTLVLLERGSWSPLGWLVFLVSWGAVAVLLVRQIRWMAPDLRGYLDVISTSELARNPAAFIEGARERSDEFKATMAKRGVRLDCSLEDLARVTKLVRDNGPQVQSDASFLCLAAAWFGETLRVNLRGEWQVWKKAGYSDAVVRLGTWTIRHHLSPGHLIFQIAADSDLSLEAVVANEIAEMNLEPLEQ